MTLEENEIIRILGLILKETIKGNEIIEKTIKEQQDTFKKLLESL